jgi:phage gp29-like protein
MVDDLKPAQAAPDTQTLESEIVTPTTTGVRQVFDEFVAASVTPARLSAILRDAAMGEMQEFLTLAEEMEEREGQYASQLRTRKSAIKAIEPAIVAGKGARAREIADAVRDELVETPAFKQMLPDALDALGKGYSATEIIWKLGGRRWSVDRYCWRDPRLFQFDRENRRELRIRALGTTDGLPLPPFKFIVHLPKLKSGLPARNGLARIACWHFMLKSYTLKDWASFLEVHGMPLRLGKYPGGTSNKDKAVLLRAVRDLGSDAAAIIPQGMEIEFVETKGFSEKPFEGLAKYLDQQLSKIILGQTMTADDGSSMAQAKVHDKVRVDIKEDDAEELENTLNRDLIRPWIDLNYGPQQHYPSLRLPVLEREDLQVYPKAIAELVDRGLEIEQDEVRERIGHRAPREGARLMRPSGKGQADTPARVGLNSARGFSAEACPGCGSALALNEAGLTGERDAIAEEGLRDWQTAMEPIRERIEAEFRAATDFDDLDRRLAAVAAELPVGELARAIAIMGMKARGLGAARDDG